MSKKITIQEMAKKANVSVATISRAVNPETRNKIAPETLKKMDALIKKYNYTPNRAAKHLRQAAYKTIGILFPHHEGMLKSEYYTQLLSGVADAILNSDYQMKMILLKPDRNPWDSYDFKHGEGVDGLIVTYWRSFFRRPQAFRALGVPCVVINNCEANIKARFVAGDHYQGARMAAKYLYEKGHRRVAILKGKYDSPDVIEKLRGFQSWMDDHQVPASAVKIIKSENYQESDAYAVTDLILDANPPITATFCVNDTLAQGVLNRMKDRQFSCPEKLSVVGYDNDRKSEHSYPALTTIQVPVYELAKLATQDLIQFLKDKKNKDFFSEKRLPVTLVERQSVGVV